MRDNVVTMRIAIGAALLWAVTGAMVGCGGSGGTGTGGTYSCQAAFPGADGGARSLAVCIEASGGSAQDNANNRQQCMAQGNTFVAEPCPRAGAVGGCRETTIATSAVLTTWYYQDGGSTAAGIRMICEGLATVAPSLVMIQFVTP